jgi:NAD-dependent SIR2 family protein deacetylase
MEEREEAQIETLPKAPYVDWEPHEAVLRQAADLLKRADAVWIGTGAGMGVASGLGTFRGKNAGVWPPLLKLKMDFTEMSNPRWFTEDPHLAWAFWQFRYNAYTGSKPHSGYDFLCQLCKEKPFGGFVFTSNIDGHWLSAGFPEDRVLEVHGSVNYMQCHDEDCESGIWPAHSQVIKALTIDEATDRAVGTLPQCIHCKDSIARPNVLMFNDGGFLPDRYLSQRSNYEKWCDRIKDAKLVVIEIGAGVAIPTVRHKAESFLRKPQQTIGIIRINPENYSFPSYATTATTIPLLSIPLNGEVALTQISRFINEESK